jgi:hypothetical protein
VIACRIHLGINLDRHSLTAFGRALALLSAVILIALRWPFGLERLALTAGVTTLWACLTVLDPKAKAPLLATLNSAVRRTQ